VSNVKKPGTKARQKKATKEIHFTVAPDTEPREEKTPGAVMAEEVRARANTLTDAERESLMAYAMRAIYGEESSASHAHRR
jgi:hypothetical protein